MRLWWCSSPQRAPARGHHTRRWPAAAAVRAPGELLEQLAALDVGVVAGAVAYTLIVAVVAGDLLAARLSGRRAADRAQLRAAATLAAGAVAAGAVYGAAVVAVYTHLAAAVPWHPWMRTHPAAAFAVAVVAVDAASWSHHFVSHRTRWGWVCHRPHHTGDTYDATLALRQSWLPLPSLLVMPTVAVTGAPLGVFLAAGATVAAYSAATHIGAPLRFPHWYSAVFVTPATHRHHHADGAANLGAVLTVWDRLAGTHEPAPDPLAPVGVNPGRNLRESLTAAQPIAAGAQTRAPGAHLSAPGVPDRCTRP